MSHTPSLVEDDDLNHLIDELRDDDPAVRLAVAHDLQEYGDRAVLALDAALTSAQPLHQEVIVRTLGVLTRDIPSARRCLENLRDDPWLGRLAERTLAQQPAPPIDWQRWLDSVGMLFLLTGALVGLANEVLTWLGLLTRVEGIALQISFGWGVLGAFGGAVMGARSRHRLWFLVDAKKMGLAGAIAGALVGRVVALWLEPLLRALG
jgi:hypothetical protein